MSKNVSPRPSWHLLSIPILFMALGVPPSGVQCFAQVVQLSQCPACVFGPQVFNRLTSQPRTERAEFGADPEADYVIDIDDRGSQGADGGVILNNQVLLAPRTAADVGPRHVRQTVLLRVQNTLVVTLTGKPGSSLLVQVLGGTKSVGAAGGSVKVPGGGLRLDIPQFSLPRDTEISIYRAPGFNPPNVLEGVTPLGLTWSLEPRGLVFDKPVKMSINYGAVLSQVSSPDEIGVVHWDDSGMFAEPISAVDDPSANELTFSLGHFSWVSIVRASPGFTTYRMHWSITPFSVHPRFEEALWTTPTRALDFTTADGGSISVLHQPWFSSFTCPPEEPFWIVDQTGMTCIPTPGLGVERVLDGRNHVTIVLFDSQITNPGEASTALMHQLGHALGIAHPWRLPFPLGSWWVNPGVYPVMSSIWWSGLPTGPKLVRNSLHPLDIAAIQSKYGTAVPPQPSTIFDNGASSGPQQNIANIAGQQSLFENFTFSQNSVITGISWAQHDHLQATYLNTEVLIFAGLPFSAPPVFSANIVASRTPNSTGTIFGSWDGFDYAINGLSINLAPGTYWVGLNSRVSNNSFGSSWDNTTGGPNTISGSRVVNVNFPAPGLSINSNLAFKLLGR